MAVLSGPLVLILPSGSYQREYREQLVSHPLLHAEYQKRKTTLLWHHTAAQELIQMTLWFYGCIKLLPLSCEAVPHQRQNNH